jgi:hypothetical protein
LSQKIHNWKSYKKKKGKCVQKARPPTLFRPLPLSSACMAIDQDLTHRRLSETYSKEESHGHGFKQVLLTDWDYG